MKKLVKRVVNGALSLVTTCLIMAAPVAAMIYASEPATAIESFSIKDSTPPAYRSLQDLSDNRFASFRIKEATPPAYTHSRRTGSEDDFQGEQWEADRTNYFYALTGKE